MHDHEECMIVPEVCKTPDCTTGGVRVVAQKGFISSRRERVNNIWWCIIVSMHCCPCSMQRQMIGLLYKFVIYQTS